MDEREEISSSEEESNDGSNYFKQTEINLRLNASNTQRNFFINPKSW